MKFTETNLPGVFIIEPQKIEDARGYFARAWCANEFVKMGIPFQPVQVNLGYSKKRGTLRGLHYQIAPGEEAKLIRCIRGAIFDVVIDLRPDSDTYKHWLGVELSANNQKMLFMPEGFAHGYQTLQDETEVFYQVSQFYAPEFERGIRWDDLGFKIQWPVTKEVILSEKDRSWPDFSDSGHDLQVDAQFERIHE